MLYIYIYIYIFVNFNFNFENLIAVKSQMKSNDLTVASEVNEPFRYQCLAEAFWCCKGLTCRRTSVAAKTV